jgi:hypothetical protein
MSKMKVEDDNEEDQWHDQDQLLVHALSYIAYSGKELTLLELTSKRWQALSKSDDLWSIVCRRNFGLRSPDLPIQHINPLPVSPPPPPIDRGSSSVETLSGPVATQSQSYREAWMEWREKLLGMGMAVPVAKK